MKRYFGPFTVLRLLAWLLTEPVSSRYCVEMVLGHLPSPKKGWFVLVLTRLVTEVDDHDCDDHKD